MLVGVAPPEVGGVPPAVGDVLPGVGVVPPEVRSVLSVLDRGMLVAGTEIEVLEKDNGTETDWLAVGTEVEIPLVLIGRPLEVVTLTGAATRSTLETTSCTGSSPQVSMIWSKGCSETGTLLDVMELSPVVMVELYTVCPSMTTAKLQSVS